MQTSVSLVPPVAVNGMLAYPNHDNVIISGACNVAAGIKAGKWCVQTAEARQFIVPTTGTHVTPGLLAQGISVLLSGREPHSDGVDFHRYEMMNVLRRGFIWVLTESSATFGAQPYVRVSAGVGEELGSFRHDADTADAVLAPGCIWRSTRADAGLALVEINLPQTWVDT